MKEVDDMDAYVFRASLFCKDCARSLKLECSPAHSEDSDVYPQGPYPMGGGEADCPQHCDSCGLFLQNPLTPDGVAYVRERLAMPLGSKVFEEWSEFYGIKPGAE